MKVNNLDEWWKSYRKPSLNYGYCNIAIDDDNLWKYKLIHVVTVVIKVYNTDTFCTKKNESRCIWNKEPCKTMLNCVKQERLLPPPKVLSQLLDIQESLRTKELWSQERYLLQAISEVTQSNRRYVLQFCLIHIKILTSLMFSSKKIMSASPF